MYHTDGQAAIVPDVFLSLDVQVPENWWEKQNRCYMIWRFGKPHEVVQLINSFIRCQAFSNKSGSSASNH